MIAAFVLFGASTAVGQGLDYQGLEPGTRFALFLEEMRPLAPPNSVSCQTSPRTAQIMECGVEIQQEGRDLWLSIHVIGGIVSMLAVTDRGDETVLNSWQQQLFERFGDGTATRRRMIQWVRGEAVARLTWRVVEDGHRIAFTIAHDPTVARILDYLPAKSGL